MNDDDPGEGSLKQDPNTKSEVRATDTRSEANQYSFSLKDLRGLRKDYTRQCDESIISWLVCLWDAAGRATILDGTEARHLGSFSVVKDNQSRYQKILLRLSYSTWKQLWNLVQR